MILFVTAVNKLHWESWHMTHDLRLLFPHLVSGPVCLSKSEHLLLPKVGFMFKGTNFSFNTKLKSTTSLEAQPKNSNMLQWLVDWPHDNGGIVSTVASSEVFPSVILSFPLTLESKPSLNVTLLYWFQIKDQLHIESLRYYAHIGKKKLYFSTCFCFSKKIRSIISQIFIISSKIDMS